MSSVSPSTDNSLADYYRQTMKDIAGQVREEANKHEQQREEEVNRLEKGYALDLRKREEEAARVANEIRDSADENRGKLKESYDREIDQLKADKRDSNAFDRTEKVKKEYSSALDDLSQQLDVEKKRHRELEESQSDRWNKAIESEIIKREKDSADTVSTIRDTSVATLDRNREQMRAEVEEAKRQLYNSRGIVPGAVPPEVHKYQINELNDALDRQRQNAEKTYDAREAEYNQTITDANRKSENQIHKINQQSSKTIENLASELRKLNDYTNETRAKKSDANSVMEWEAREGQKATLRRIENEYNDRADKLKRNADEKEAYLDKNSEQLLREKEGHFTDLLSQQNQRNSSDLDYIQKTMSAQLKDLQKQEKETRERTEKNASDRLVEADVARQKALENQAKTFKEVFDRERVSNKDDVETLQRALKAHEAPGSIALVPPSVEDSIRKSVIREYEKTLNTEIEHNKQRAEESHRKYAESQRAAADTFQDRAAQTSRQNALDTAYAKTEFMNSITETESNAQNQVKTEREQNNREVEALKREYDNFIDRQRRQYEFVIANDRNDAEIRVNNVRQQAAIDYTNLHRDMSQRQSDTVREFNAKMENQRQDYEAQIQDLKLEATTTQRDMERRTAQTIDFQIKNYEQRIKEIESQNQERQRTISQNYEEQIDRIKRGYELSKKKG